MSIDKFNKNILKNVDSLKDLGQDIQKNMSGFLDTKIDTLGKTLDTASSFAFGKLKRMKGDLKKITDGVLKFDKSMPAITLNTSGKSSGEELDWRVSLSIPQQIKDIIQDQKSLLDPLKATGNKLVFPYTPTILVGQSASWNPMQPVHTNYPFYAYENSRVDQMTITAHFYVQNEIEAREAELNWLDYIVYLKGSLNEKFASKAQQRFLYATNPKVAKKLGSKMTKKDYKKLPDKVEEDLENWSYDGNSIGVEKELDEYCPMGKPNKCKLVDYNNLPDMIKSETIEEQFGKELTTADAIKRDIMKVLSMRFVLTPTEDGKIKDSSGQSYVIVDTENPFEEVTLDMLIEPIINMFNHGIKGGELSPQDTNIAISGVTDWLSLAMNQTVELPN